MAYAYCVNKTPAILGLCVSLKYAQKVCLRVVTAPPHKAQLGVFTSPRVMFTEAKLPLRHMNKSDML